MSALTLRAAAALFVETGRALGTAEQAKATARALGALVEFHALHTQAGHEHERLLDALRATAKAHVDGAVSCERLALSAQAHAERLLAGLEHPGATLAKRVLRALRALREAWRAPTR